MVKRVHTAVTSVQLQCKFKTARLHANSVWAAPTRAILETFDRLTRSSGAGGENDCGAGAGDGMGTTGADNAAVSTMPATAAARAADGAAAARASDGAAAAAVDGATKVSDGMRAYMERQQRGGSELAPGRLWARESLQPLEAEVRNAVAAWHARKPGGNVQEGGSSGGGSRKRRRAASPAAPAPTPGSRPARCAAAKDAGSGGSRKRRRAAPPAAAPASAPSIRPARRRAAESAAAAISRAAIMDEDEDPHLAEHEQRMAPVWADAAAADAAAADDIVCEDSDDADASDYGMEDEDAEDEDA
jgi:hypothetical protein